MDLRNSIYEIMPLSSRNEFTSFFLVCMSSFFLASLAKLEPPVILNGSGENGHLSLMHFRDMHKNFKIFPIKYDFHCRF